MTSRPDLTPQFLAYDDGPFIIRMSIAMGLLATLFVGLRVWARTYTRIKHGLDDSIVISAMVGVPSQHNLPVLIFNSVIYLWLYRYRYCWKAIRAHIMTS
jgi:hypothetical protein